MAVGVPLQNTELAGKVGTNTPTVRLIVQDCPPTITTKFAIPLEAGVPVMV
jgi:hypothetical protein